MGGRLDIYALKTQLESRINEIKSLLPAGAVISTEAMNQRSPPPSTASRWKATRTAAVPCASVPKLMAAIGAALALMPLAPGLGPGRTDGAARPPWP